MTTNHQLNDMAKKLNLKHFLGVFMCDELKEINLRENMCFIFNFQDSDQTGSHWALAYKKGDEKIYFDSYGSHPPIQLQNLFGTRILYSNFQIQSFGSDYCGEICLLVAYLLENSKDDSLHKAFVKIATDLFCQ